MKKIVSVLFAAIIALCSVTVAVPQKIRGAATAAAESEKAQVYASFSLKANSTAVENDPRFSSYATFETARETREFHLFHNGENDWSHADLSRYIGNNEEADEAYLSFWFRASGKGKFKVRFFHTNGGVYSSTNEKEITVNKAAQWQAVNIPMKEFTYSAGDDYCFARFDIVTENQSFNKGRLLISDVCVQSAAAPEYVPAESVYLPETEIGLQVNQYKSLNPIFISKKGEYVLPAEMTWTSSDTSVVSVDENGVVLGRAEGTATVTGRMSAKVSVSAEVTVSGVHTVNTVARFTNNSCQYEVNGDPRFNYNLSFQGQNTVVLFHNGTNDWAHADLTGYVNAESDAYVSFWIKTSYKGTLSFNFFHTYNGEYGGTTPVKIAYDTPDKWQAVVIPMNDIKYTVSDNLLFARADINFLSGGMDEKKDYIKLSPITVTDSKPIIPVLFEPEDMKLNHNDYIMNAESSFDLVAEFISSKGDAAPEEVSWSSSNESILTVDRSGHVKALKPGTASVTCKSESGKFTDTCNITVSEREKSRLLWEFGSSYVWSTPSVSVSGRETDDPRFSLAMEAVRKNNDAYTIQFFRNGSESGNIEGCTEFGVLRFWVKVPRDNTVFTVSMTANNGAHYTGTSSYTVKVDLSNGWQRVEIPLSEFEFAGDFEYNYLRFITVSSVEASSVPTGCFNTETGDTIKFAGMQVWDHSPDDPAGPEYDPVESLSLETDYFSIKQGARCKLTPEILPKTADLSYTYVNVSDGIAIDSDGVVTAEKPGTYTVKVISDASDKFAEAIIEVTEIPKDEKTKMVFEVNFDKGVWTDSRDGSMGLVFNRLETTDPNYYRFRKTMSYWINEPEVYYPQVVGEFTMLFGGCVSQDSLDYFKLNLMPYLETATLRFWVKAPRDNIRMMIGFNDPRYNTIKYNYTIEKGGEWQEVQIPIKDIFDTNPSFDRNKLMHLIFSAATDIAADSEQALKTNEVIEFGYMQIWTKEAPPVKWYEIDNTRYFYDDSDQKVWLADLNLALPELTDVRFCVDADSVFFEMYRKYLSPSELISTMDVRAMYFKTGRRFDNNTLSDILQIRFALDHPCFKGNSPESLTYAILRDGQLTELSGAVKNGYFALDIDGFETILIYKKVSGQGGVSSGKTKYIKRVTETVVKADTEDTETDEPTKIRKKRYRLIKGTDEEASGVIYWIIGGAVASALAAAAILLVIKKKKHTRKG